MGFCSYRFYIYHVHRGHGMLRAGIKMKKKSKWYEPMCIDVMNWIDAMGWEFHVEDVGSIPNLGIHCTVITYIIIIKQRHEKQKQILEQCHWVLHISHIKNCTSNKYRTTQNNG